MAEEAETKNENISENNKRTSGDVWHSSGNNGVGFNIYKNTASTSEN
jgi:hypothetical protein